MFRLTDLFSYKRGLVALNAQKKFESQSEIVMRKKVNTVNQK